MRFNNGTVIESSSKSAIRKAPRTQQKPDGQKRHGFGAVCCRRYRQLRTPRACGWSPVRYAKEPQRGHACPARSLGRLASKYPRYRCSTQLPLAQIPSGSSSGSHALSIRHSTQHSGEKLVGSANLSLPCSSSIQARATDIARWRASRSFTNLSRSMNRCDRVRPAPKPVMQTRA